MMACSPIRPSSIEEIHGWSPFCFINSFDTSERLQLLQNQPPHVGISNQARREGDDSPNGRSNEAFGKHITRLSKSA